MPYPTDSPSAPVAGHHPRECICVHCSEASFELGLATGDAYKDIKAECALFRALAVRVLEWNTKYPSSRIYGENAIRRIAAEMDQIAADIRAALSKVQP